MDSINREQPEVNRDNLSGAEAVRKIRELAGKGKACFSAPASRRATRRAHAR